MLDLTGEEQEITVTDSTVITKQSMGGGQGASGGEAPEKPDGDNADDTADAQSEDTDDSEKTDASDSEKPDGEAPDGNGQAPDGAGQTEEITLDDIKEGDVVAITLDDDRKRSNYHSPVHGMAVAGRSWQLRLPVWTAMMQQTSSSDETVSDTTRESGTDENAELVSNGAEVTLSNDAISRTSRTARAVITPASTGVGAAVLATDGTAMLKAVQ